MNKTKRLKHKLDNFSARGDKCPICHKPFRHGCNHSIKQAKDRLFEDYVRSIVDERN